MYSGYYGTMQHQAAFDDGMQEAAKGILSFGALRQEVLSSFLLVVFGF